MGYVFLDFSGGVTNFAQLSVQSIDQGLSIFHISSAKSYFSIRCFAYCIFELANFYRFLGELLWRYREDNDISGMISHLLFLFFFSFFLNYFGHVCLYL